VAKANEKTRCSAPGCSRPVHARGLCQMHYDQSRSREAKDGPKPTPAARGAAGEPQRSAHTTCSFPGCAAPHHAKGYCKSHYSQVRRRGKSKSGQGRAAQCEIAGCSRLAVRNKRCANHLKVVKDGPRLMTKAERLGEIRRRHELMRREIETIRKSFENEADD